MKQEAVTKDQSVKRFEGVSAADPEPSANCGPDVAAGAAADSPDSPGSDPDSVPAQAEEGDFHDYVRDYIAADIQQMWIDNGDAPPEPTLEVEIMAFLQKRLSGKWLASQAASAPCIVLIKPIYCSFRHCALVEPFQEV